MTLEVMQAVEIFLQTDLEDQIAQSNQEDLSRSNQLYSSIRWFTLNKAKSWLKENHLMLVLMKISCKQLKEEELMKKIEKGLNKE